MNIKSLAVLICFVCLSSLTFAQYNIEFKVNGLQKGDACILAYYYADQNKIVDTSKVNSTGKVVFSGSKNLLNGVYILVLPKRTYLEFVVPIDDQIFTIQLDTSLNPENKIAIGSTENEAFFEFDKFTAKQGLKLAELRRKFKETKDEQEQLALKAEMDAVTKSVDTKRRDIINRNPTSFTAKLFRSTLELEFPEELTGDTTGARFLYYRNHYWDLVDLKDDGLLRTPIYKDKLVYYLTKLFIQTPDSLIPAIDELCSRLEANKSGELYKYTVWWSANHYEESNLMCMDKVLHHMAKNYYCAGKCFWADSTTIKNMCDHAVKIEPTLCGKIAPPLTLVDSTFATEMDLHNIKAPVTVLVFWDHQCGHCKQELPKLKAMYDTLNIRGVEIYAVYTKDDYKGWKKYIRENQLNWINVMDAFHQSAYRKNYDFNKTPQVLILDYKKEIMFKNPPADQVGYIADLMLQEYEERIKLPKK